MKTNKIVLCPTKEIFVEQLMKIGNPLEVSFGSWDTYKEHTYIIIESDDRYNTGRFGDNRQTEKWSKECIYIIVPLNQDDYSLTF